jgi:hypothetical protein
MKLDLHDCTIEELRFVWATGILTIVIWRYSTSLQKSVLCNLVLSGVTEVIIPQENPWGSSNAINNASFENGQCKIEMQSGDLLKAKFSEVKFEENHS